MPHALRLPPGTREPGLFDYVVAGVAMIAASMALGGLLAVAVNQAVGACMTVQGEIWRELCFFPMIIGAGGLFGLPALPVGILLMWALRGAGFGGWAVAMALGVGLGLAAGFLMWGGGEPLVASDWVAFAMLASAGAVLALLFWSVVYLRCRPSAPPPK